VRYNLGMSNIATDDFNSGGDDIYNRVLQFSVGYVIPMKGGETATSSIAF